MKRTLLTFSTLAIIYLSVSSSASGPTASGLSQPTSGCDGATCHGIMVDTTVLSSLTLKHKATGIAVTNDKYVPGEVYTVTINGNYPGASTFGFYVAAYQAYTVPTGAFSNLPANTRLSTLASGVEIVDHTVPFTASGGAFTTSFDWTAPYGLYYSHFHVVINATNGDGVADNKDKYMTRQFKFTEAPGFPSAIGGINNNISVITYPNPATNVLHIDIGSNTIDSYKYTIYNTTGTATIGGLLDKNINSIDIASLPAGTHFIAITNGNEQKVISFSKL